MDACMHVRTHVCRLHAIHMLTLDQRTLNSMARLDKSMGFWLRPDFEVDPRTRIPVLVTRKTGP